MGRGLPEGRRRRAGPRQGQLAQEPDGFGTEAPARLEANDNEAATVAGS